MNKNLLTIQRAAHFIGVSTKTLRRWESAGKLVPIRTIGNQRRYTIEELQEYKNKKVQAASLKYQASNPQQFSPRGFGFKVHDEGILSESIASDIKHSRLNSKEPEVIQPLDSFSYLKLEVAGISSAKKRILGSFLFAFSLLVLAVSTKTAVESLNTNFHSLQTGGQQVTQAQNANPQAVLGSSIEPASYVFRVNVPSSFSQAADFQSGITIQGKSIILGGVDTQNGDLNAGTGKITASNIVYGLTAGTGLSVSGGQNPTLTNTGVTSLGGSSGSLDLTGGTGITIDGLKVSNSDLGSSQNIFKNVVVGSSTITAGSNTDTLNIAAGTGVTLTSNTSTKTITISSANGGGGVTSLNTQTGALTLAAGTGLSLSGLTFTNTGVTSLGGSTGALTLAGGTGISVSGLTVTNTDLGTLQNIFKNFTVAGSTISATTNNDNLTLAAGSNITLTPDTNTKTITIASNISNSTINTVSGWTQSGNYVTLTNSGNYVGIGTPAPSNTLDVAGTFGVSGASSLSGTLDVLSATTIAPTTSGSTTSLTVRAANSSTGNVLNITNATGATSYLSIDNNGSLTVGGSTLTNAGLLESSGAIHLTNAANTIVGTAILGGWTMNSNTYTYRRAITVTNTSGSTLPKNYQISVNLSSAASSQVYSNSQTASPYKDFRIAWDNTGSFTEIARNVSSFTSSNVTFAFQLAGNISAGATDTYYIYYSNSALASISAAYSSYIGDVQLDSADSVTNWATGDNTNYGLSHEATIKQEGTGSVKSAALAGNIGALSTASQGQLPQTLKKLSAIKASITGSDYVYVLGGNNGTSDQTTAYKAAIDGSGNVGTLSTASQGQLPQALSGHAAVSVVQSIDSGTGTDGTLDLSLGSGAGGCNGTGLSWDAGTSTCTITQATKSTFNFTNINIPSGKTLAVSGSAYAPVTLKAAGSVTVAGAISYYDGNITILTSGAVSISGSIITNGYSGLDDDCDVQPATPGDNAGPITIKSTNAITNTGTVSANGGSGGNALCSANGQNGGNGGTITLWDSDGVITGTFTVAGGAGGSRSSSSFSNGLPGSAGTVTKSSSSVPPYIYILGGINGATRQSTVYRSSITGSDLGAFSTASQGQLPVALNNLSANAVTISNVNYLYVLGGNNGTSDVSAVYKSTVDSNGNAGAFSTTSQGQLPQTLSQQSSVIVSVGGTNYLYILGGINGVIAQSTVYKATIDGSGNIGAFSAVSQTQLPSAIYDASVFSAIIGTTNYIYLVGGKNSAGNPVNTIYRGTLDGSGNVMAWTASGTLPQSISSSVSITSSAGGSNSLYLIGGANPSAISTTYKALVNDMSGFSLTKTLASSVDLSNKNNIQFGYYSSQTGSFNIFEFSQNGSDWTQCANNSDFSSGTFVVNSANVWETKTCDISSVATASKSAVLYFRTRVSANQTADFTTYIDNIQGVMNAATISNTFSFSSAVLGASDLNLNAQGTGAVKVNYDATNGLAGTGGLIVYNGSASALLTVGSAGTVTLTGNMISPLTGVAGYWQRGSGVISPTNITDDLLIGGTSTTSAKFSVTGIAKNQPLASLSGQFIVMPQNGWGGQVGIGTINPQFKLDVTDLQNATVSAIITNSSTNANAGVLALKVGNTTPALTNYFTTFLNGNGAIVGKIQGNGSGGVTYSTSGVDFAEYFRKENSSEILNAGDIVCLGLTGGATKCENSTNILGVVSNKAGFVGGGQHDQDPNYVAVGLVGQLKVNVSSESGQINPGDSITVSSKGFAVKAISSGQIVGQALESYSGQESNAILVRINITWHQSQTDADAFLNSVANATISANFASSDTLDIKNATISSLMVLGRTTLSDLGVTGKINSGLLTINGFDDSVNSGQVTVNTLAGDLYLQNKGLGGVNILNGLVTIDTQGNMNITGVLGVGTVKTSKLIMQGNVGSATLSAGLTQVEIDNPGVAPTSKVFVTLRTLINVPLVVDSIGTGKFIVKIPSAQASDVKFDWWVVGTQ